MIDDIDYSVSRLKHAIREGRKYAGESDLARDWVFSDIEKQSDELAKKLLDAGVTRGYIAGEPNKVKY